jgi:DUF4097 and DUF4098 domain-containing protein YvlB
MAVSQRVLLLMAGAALSASSAAAQNDWCREDGRWNDRQQRYCEVREHTLSGTGRLSVDARPNGGIEVVAWERGDIRLEAKVVAQAETEGEARDLASQVQIETSNTVRADGPRSGRRSSWSVSYRLHVPRSAELQLTSMNGGISVRGTRGDLELETSNGGLNLDDVGGRVRGKTTNGGVDLRLTGQEWQGEGVELRTSNGGVKLRVPHDYNAHIETGTVNGGVQVDFPITVHGRIDRELNLDLGRGGKSIRVHTTNGGVSLSRR